MFLSFSVPYLSCSPPSCPFLLLFSSDDSRHFSAGPDRANWIWSSTYTANTLLAARKDFVPPLGKSLIAAEIIMTGGQVEFYVNGELIGDNTPSSPYHYVGR
ncbi:hypothetical protein B0H13DRAFT_1933889, partial [Mycena leptocephala]